MISNENFVCTINYNTDGKISLKICGIPPIFWNLLN